MLKHIGNCLMILSEKKFAFNYSAYQIVKSLFRAIKACKTVTIPRFA